MRSVAKGARSVYMSALAVLSAVHLGCASTAITKAVDAKSEREAKTCAPPIYPSNAVFMGVQGTTEVLAEVSSDGKVSNAVVSKSSGATNEHKELDRATLAYIRSCTFLKKPEHAYDHRTIRFNWLLAPGL